jgi:ABC-2 type transport system permease protein
MGEEGPPGELAEELTALNDALRAVMIDGSGVRAIATQLGILALIAAVSFATALRIFRWR